MLSRVNASGEFVYVKYHFLVGIRYLLALLDSAPKISLGVVGIFPSILQSLFGIE
jgi:hypothetical protein